MTYNEIHAELRIIRYLSKHVQLESAQLYAWLNSVTRRGGYSWARQEEALRNLRDDGVIAVANGRWYLRAIPAGYARKFTNGKEEGT